MKKIEHYRKKRNSFWLWLVVSKLLKKTKKLWSNTSKELKTLSYRRCSTKFWRINSLTVWSNHKHLQQVFFKKKQFLSRAMGPIPQKSNSIQRVREIKTSLLTWSIYWPKDNKTYRKASGHLIKKRENLKVWKASSTQLTQLPRHFMAWWMSLKSKIEKSLRLLMRMPKEFSLRINPNLVPI